jgi:hypothetical protein
LSLRLLFDAAAGKKDAGQQEKFDFTITRPELANMGREQIVEYPEDILFADIRVKTAQGIARWEFDPRSVAVKSGLPWMRPADWVELYEIFDRPQRARTLRGYLANSSEKHP